MQIALTLAHMCPGAKFDVVQYANGSIEIEKWQYDHPQPGIEEIEAHWEENEAAILEANKPQPSELDILGQQLVQKDIEIMQLQELNSTLGQQIVDLDIRLMMGGF